MARAILLVLAGALLAGCSLLPEPLLQPDRSMPSPTTRDEAQATWLASGVRSYALTVRLGCMCTGTGTYEMTVVDGVVTDIAKDGVPVELDDQQRFLMTVNGQFAMAERIEAKGGRVDMTYHPRLGYPRTMLVDVAPNGYDDELYYEIVELSPAN